MIHKYTSQTGVYVCIPLLLFRCPGSTGIKRRVEKDVRWRDTLLHGRCKVLDCQASISNSGHLRVNVSGSKAPECQAHMEVKSFTLYPDFAVEQG